MKYKKTNVNDDILQSAYCILYEWHMLQMFAKSNFLSMYLFDVDFEVEN